MDIISLNPKSLRLKTYKKIESYCALSDNNRLTIGIYNDGKCYVLGDIGEENRLFYDIGSVSKTFTAHLILKLCDEGKLDINETIDKYLPLKKRKISNHLSASYPYRRLSSSDPIRGNPYRTYEGRLRKTQPL